MPGWGERWKELLGAFSNARSPETPGKPTPAAPECPCKCPICRLPAHLPARAQGRRGSAPAPSELSARASHLRKLSSVLKSLGNVVFRLPTLQHRIVSLKKMFFSFSRATENYQKRYLHCSKRRRRYMRSACNFWSSLMSTQGKQVPFGWGVHAFPQTHPLHLPSCFSHLTYFAQSRPHPPCFNSSFQLRILGLGLTFSKKPSLTPPAWAGWSARSLYPRSPWYMPLRVDFRTCCISLK